MSGITGIWNLDGRPLESALLAAMGSRQSHRGPDEAGRWVEGPVGLACQILRVAPESAAGFQPVVHRSGVVAVFDGRIDNREDFLSAFHYEPAADVFGIRWYRVATLQDGTGCLFPSADRELPKLSDNWICP